MNIVAVGVSHHTAPIEIREQLAVPTGLVPELLHRLRAEHIGREALLLSTCNRVELYVVPAEGRTPEELVGFLAANSGLKDRALRAHIFRYQAEDAVRHVFRVASSLDSMVVGEPQITGQLREAYRLATDERSAGPVLHRVIDRALSVAKRVRTETGIGREAVSVGRAGVELSRQVLGELSGRSALLIGAGAHGKLVAKAMLGYGLGELVVTNRTFDRASELAAQLGAAAAPMDDIARIMERVDVVIACTGAGRALISRAELAPVMRRRRLRSIVMIDLSVPRNIDPDVNQIDGVYRFDVDDLRQIADVGMEKRKVAAVEAERIVSEEAVRAWRQLQVDGLIGRVGGIARRAEAIRAAELGRAGLTGLDPKQQKAIEAMTKAIVKKILHPSLAQARALAEAGEVDRLEALLATLGDEGEGT